MLKQWCLSQVTGDGLSQSEMSVTDNTGWFTCRLIYIIVSTYYLLYLAIVAQVLSWFVYFDVSSVSSTFN